MKVVRTVLTEEERKLLEEYAKRNSKSIKQVVREAVRSIAEGKVNPEDPIFSSLPSSRKTGKKDNASVEHDLFLYGEEIS